MVLADAVAVAADVAVLADAISTFGISETISSGKASGGSSLVRALEFKTKGRRLFLQEASLPGPVKYDSLRYYKLFVLFHRTSYLAEEVSGTETLPFASVPWVFVTGIGPFQTVQFWHF